MADPIKNVTKRPPIGKVDPARSTGGMQKADMAARIKAAGLAPTRTTDTGAKVVRSGPTTTNTGARLDTRMGAKPGSGIEEPRPLPTVKAMPVGMKLGGDTGAKTPVKRMPVKDVVSGGKTPVKRIPSKDVGSLIGKDRGHFNKAKTNLNSQGKATARPTPFKAKVKEVRLENEYGARPNPKAVTRKRRTAKRSGLKGMPAQKGG
jgi:hypothetical protein